MIGLWAALALTSLPGWAAIVIVLGTSAIVGVLFDIPGKEDE